MSIKRLVSIPEGEVYSFSRKLFFSIFNSNLAPFMCKAIGYNIRYTGYAVYPYHENLDDETYKLIICIDNENVFNNLKNEYKSLVNVSEILIITDKPEFFNGEIFDEVTDLTELHVYYSTNLAFDEFCNYLLTDLKGSQ